MNTTKACRGGSTDSQRTFAKVTTTIATIKHTSTNTTIFGIHIHERHTPSHNVNTQRKTWPYFPYYLSSLCCTDIRLFKYWFTFDARSPSSYHSFPFCRLLLLCMPHTWFRSFIQFCVRSVAQHTQCRSEISLSFSKNNNTLVSSLFRVYSCRRQSTYSVHDKKAHERIGNNGNVIILGRCCCCCCRSCCCYHRRWCYSVTLYTSTKTNSLGFWKFVSIAVSVMPNGWYSDCVCAHWYWWATVFSIEEASQAFHIMLHVFRTTFPASIFSRVAVRQYTPCVIMSVEHIFWWYLILCKASFLVFILVNYHQNRFLYAWIARVNAKKYELIDNFHRAFIPFYLSHLDPSEQKYLRKNARK